jgi:hypothetical protein
MKLCFVFACLSLFPLIAFAQALHGTIKDGSTNEILIGANVLVKGTSNGTVTNEDGEFSLNIQNQKLPVILIVSYTGYVAHEFEVKQISSSLHSNCILIKLC